MNRQETPSAAFRVRAAKPADIPALMRLKRALAETENSLHAVRAGAADWLRDGFGPDAGFTAFVAEAENAETIIGMATCSRRVITGWNGPVVFLQDLFVEPAYRRYGVAGALVARVAALAQDIGSPIVELTVHADNPAQDFYRRNGFQLLPQCLTYVLAGPALAALAARDKDQQQDQQTDEQGELAAAG
ncbi:MAG TPA: GNAT family N-acetyltransferase [Xanthobacteraceae bacterium]|nr:GNAT family N-acetyltransferase [Xanthobacteraceae bacterium]